MSKLIMEHELLEPHVWNLKGRFHWREFTGTILDGEKRLRHVIASKSHQDLFYCITDSKN